MAYSISFLFLFLHDLDGFQATIRGIAMTLSSYIGAFILEDQGPTTALWISFVIAIIPPVIGYALVPETLGMRQIDFKQEKEEEKIQRTLSQLEHLTNSTDYVKMTTNGEGPKRRQMSSSCSTDSSNDEHEIV